MTRNAVPVVTHQDGRKEGSMKYQNGKWHYQGKVYDSLYEALIANWPKK